jgi:DNA-directed RNA polymerase subunit RPC12/RpoP
VGFLIDMTGEKFGRLTVTSRAPNNGTRAAWHCLCDCGSTLIVDGKKLRGGHTKSCGCFRKDVSSAQGRKNLLSESTVKDIVSKNGFELISNYAGIQNKATFRCLTCSLEFSRRLDSSLYSLYGCPSCSKLYNGFMQQKTFDKKPELKDLDSRLYLMEFVGESEHFWKLGITRQKLYDRVRKIPYQLVSIQTISGKLFEIYQAEKQLKRENKQNRYRPKNFFNGHTECFSKPIDIGWV